MTWQIPKLTVASLLTLALTACGGRTLPLLADGGPPEDGILTRDTRPTADLPQRFDLPQADGPRGDLPRRDTSPTDGGWWPDTAWRPDAGLPCYRNKDCSKSDFCYFAVGCGTGLPGLCQPRPMACPEVYSPVCGCNGQTYDNECFAFADKNSVLHSGACGMQACASDFDCAYGALWCENGACVPCDNSGFLCDLACPEGWNLLERNGCYPCACAPPTECLYGADCGPGRTCYTGNLCWDWCPPGEPSCCLGNFCAAWGCPSPPSALGCWQLGCPLGETCVDQGCSSSFCECDPFWGSWSCSNDCDGGICVAN